MTHAPLRDLSGLLRRAPYPGQRYRHGWVPIGVRALLADAVDVDAINRVAGAEALRITGRRIPFDLKGSDPSSAREHAEGILRGLERFPDVSLVGVYSYGPGSAGTGMATEIARLHGGAAAVTQAHGVMEGGRLVIASNVYFNTRQATTEAREEAHRGGYLVGRTPMDTALHEFGHVITNHTGAKREVYDSAVASADAAGVRNVTSYIAHHVSSYASSDMAEFAAEAFADVMINGPGASALSRSAFDVITAAYQEAGS